MIVAESRSKLLLMRIVRHHRCSISEKWIMPVSMAQLLSLAAVSCLLSWSSALHAQIPLTRKPMTVAGTYEVSICTGSCAGVPPERAQARGILVLEDSAYHVNELPESVRTYLRENLPYLTQIEARGMPNACFVLDRNTEVRPTTWAGFQSVGFTRWNQDDTVDTISTVLFRGSDVRYTARFSLRGDALRGTSVVWDATSAGEPGRSEEIVGRRLGLPDRELCIQATTAHPNR